MAVTTPEATPADVQAFLETLAQTDGHPLRRLNLSEANPLAFGPVTAGLEAEADAMERVVRGVIPDGMVLSAPVASALRLFDKTPESELREFAQQTQVNGVRNYSALAARRQIAILDAQIASQTPTL